MNCGMGDMVRELEISIYAWRIYGASDLDEEEENVKAVKVPVRPVYRVEGSGWELGLSFLCG